MNYTKRLMSCYKKISVSRLVLRNETDEESLDYFNNILNETNPKNQDESNIKYCIRKLYLNDKNSFLRCIEKDPYLILLTDTQAIVMHFKIQYSVFIKWNKIEYIVELFNKNKYY